MPDVPAVRLVRQAPRFARSKRAFPPNVQIEIDDAVSRVVADPFVGEQKSGSLKAVRVLKFKSGPQQQQLLLAYTFVSKRQTIELLDVGPHENFYRGLTQYLDARP